MYLAIEIGGTKLQIALGDARGNLLEKHKLDVDAARGGEGIRAQIKNTLPPLLAGRLLAGVGVGFGGPVDRRTGKIACSHQIEGWSGFDLAGWLKELTGAPVVVENDANTAALGEALRGAGVGCNPVFYVTLGSGVGGGLVLDGHIYHGDAPGEAEIGHVRLDRSGATLESRCSGWAVDRRIRAANTEHPTSVLAKLCRNESRGEAKHLVAALAQGDAVARRLLEGVAADLGFGLSHVAHLFHPQVIVLGGGLSGVGEPLRAAVAAALPGFIMEVFQPGPRVALAKLGEDAVPVGALCLAGARVCHPQEVDHGRRGGSS